MGFMSLVSELCSAIDDHHRNRKKMKKKQFQVVEIKVRIDCEGCERKVRQAVEGMKGVSMVVVEPRKNKLTVTGYVDPKKVLQRVRYRTGKVAEPWPYVPYDMVYHPYVPGAYDKKAPPGYVRNVVADPTLAPLARATSTEETYSAAFSDDNPNACIVM
ncbi:heavy metal-associated isoprenylated plant protein 27 [Phalaenopsis equestris]|uniref:heavy metal-associated isoprenylated plant protein 27 n=1 Tax=Phalaenopsis equestris TaxID=78828 RepID=UPI0009E1C8F3|nr:heavy metal-associated isoprenylated plant protein 27 [Phalaenopsis equestris]